MVASEPSEDGGGKTCAITEGQSFHRCHEPNYWKIRELSNCLESDTKEDEAGEKEKIFVTA